MSPKEAIRGKFYVTLHVHHSLNIEW